MKKLIVIASLLITSFVYSAEQDLLKIRLNGLSSMKASFKQIVKEGGRVIQRNNGLLYLQRPGKFRWLISLPTKQLIISNGKVLWIYDEDLEQVTIKKLDQELKGTPALFLSGYDKKLTDDYAIKYIKLKNIETFILTPKILERNSYAWIKLIYQKSILNGLSLKDKLGQTTTLSFYNIKSNLQLDSKLFNFIPPKDVDVVN